MGENPWSDSKILEFVRLSLSCAPDPEMDRDVLRIVEEKLACREHLKDEEIARILATLDKPSEPLETEGPALDSRVKAAREKAA